MRPLAALLVAGLALCVAGACKKQVDDATSDDTPIKKKKPKVDDPKSVKAPEKHRAVHEVCSNGDTKPATKSTFAPRMPIEPGPACASKGDCKAQANGRCSEGHCTYDACYEDKDCKGGVCTCEQEGIRGYYCKAGNCAVDSDCGEKGFCSPTWNMECGGFFGVTGFYCHTDKDECTDDSECVKEKNTGYCAYSLEKKHWLCGYGMCVG